MRRSCRSTARFPMAEMTTRERMPMKLKGTWFMAGLPRSSAGAM